MQYAGLTSSITPVRSVIQNPSGEVSRIIDTLLEKEIYRQQSSLSGVSQELSALKTVETMFGELSSESVDEILHDISELESDLNNTLVNLKNVLKAKRFIQITLSVKPIKIIQLLQQ